MPLQTTKSTREIRLKEALKAIESGYFSSNSEVARVFDVPLSTLRLRLAKSAKPASKNGGYNKKLSDMQEKIICEWLDRSARHGFPFRQEHIHQLACKILAESGISSPTLGKCWVKRFLKRHPHYHTRRNIPLDVRRHIQHNRDEILTFLRLYADVVQQFDITSNNIWNMDETGCFIGVNKPTHVVVPKSMKQAYINDPQNREWTTLIETVSGAGISIPPYIILTGKVHLAAWYETNLPKNYVLACTDNGFSNNIIGLSWLEHFNKHTFTNQSRLLIIDGHDSHISTEFIDYCYNHNIWPLCLPPHTTHLLQPLDVGCFQPLKHYLGLAVDASIRLYNPASLLLLHLFLIY